jgi:YVTN family beta-propeller protein
MKRTSLQMLCASLVVLLALPAMAAPTVYIPLGSGNQVIAVDAASDTITASYTGVTNPHGLVATPDGEYLIAGSLFETPLKPGEDKGKFNSQLFFVHPAHGHVMSTIPVPGWTHHEAITPDGRYVISTHGARGFVSVVDLQQNKVVRTVATGLSPNYTLVSADGKRAFVSNSGNNTISEIDLGSWKVIRTLEGGPAPTHMVFSKDGTMIFVVNPQAGKVSAVSIASGKVSKQYAIGKGVHAADISDDGKTLFAASKKDEKLVAVDIRSGQQRSIRLSPEPYHLNTIRDTGKIYVSSSKKPLIWVIDQKTLKQLGQIELPAGEGHQMAIVP